MQTWIPVLNYLAAFAAGALAAWWIVRLRRRHGSTEPTCPKCGYAVVGLVAARCPECGNDLGKSGVVAPGGGGRIRVWWLVGWTVGIIALGTWIGDSQRQGFVMVCEGKIQIYLQFHDAQQVGVELRGTGYGRLPPVQEIRIRMLPYSPGITDPLPPGGATLIWAANPTPETGAPLTAAGLEKWLRDRGIKAADAGTLSTELLAVVEAAARLPTVDDLKYGSSWVTVGGERQLRYQAAGVTLHEFECSASTSSWSSHWLLRTGPWIFTAFTIVWLAGLKLFLPRRRTLVPYAHFPA